MSEHLRSARGHAEMAAELLEKAILLRSEGGPGEPSRLANAAMIEQRAQVYALTAIALAQTQGAFS